MRCHAKVCNAAGALHNLCRATRKRAGCVGARMALGQQPDLGRAQATAHMLLGCLAAHECRPWYVGCWHCMQMRWMLMDSKNTMQVMVHVWDVAGTPPHQMGFRPVNDR